MIETLIEMGTVRIATPEKVRTEGVPISLILALDEVWNE